MLGVRASAKNPAHIDVRDRSSPRSTWLTVNLARFAAIAIAAIAIGTLVGWALDMPMLKRLLPNAVEVKANTALALLLLAGSLFLLGNLASLPARRWRRFARILAALAGLLAAAKLGEYAFGWQLGIDEFLFLDNASASSARRTDACPLTARWHWFAPQRRW